MEHMNPRGDDLATPEEFAAWLKRQLEQRGYDLRPRGGGQTKFATDSGIGAGTVSRMLRGQSATETRVLQTLAQSLQLPLSEVLVAAGVLNRVELENVRHPAPRTNPLTPEQAADELGITDPQSRRLFISMTETLRQQRAENGEGRIAEN
ncbi:helix-turn-helix transcriptional regulator [Streptomyces sp. FIT100]|uniref:helix-turn-helix domain-containing protein n=1 Tax=Streptomyces sp. FIT100 TaxID=2837956 RepID=UPI0021CA007C|nr:helix-turn-helix transcriptional regulator [Streptomyces sp. FIT100]UUN29448.1 helix-turn-helix transcriptional regulator [Streptomyces sp. FIT100]